MRDSKGGVPVLLASCCIDVAVGANLRSISKVEGGMVRRGDPGVDGWTRPSAETWLLGRLVARGVFGRVMNARGETRSMLPTKRRDEIDDTTFAGLLAAFIIMVGC